MITIKVYLIKITELEVSKNIKLTNKGEKEVILSASTATFSMQNCL